MKTIKITKDILVNHFDIFSQPEAVRTKLLEALDDRAYYINGVINFGDKEDLSLANEMVEDGKSIYIPLHQHTELESDGDRYYTETDIYQELVSKVELEAWCEVMANHAN